MFFCYISMHANIVIHIFLNKTQQQIIKKITKPYEKNKIVCILIDLKAAINDDDSLKMKTK